MSACLVALQFHNILQSFHTNQVYQDLHLGNALEIIQKELDISVNEKLRNIKLTRFMIKKSIMTIPYNITLFGVIEQLKEHFKKY